MIFRILQNCYQDEQLKSCSFEPYFNPPPTHPDERYLFFESQVISDLVLKGWQSEADWFAVLGHNWQGKLQASQHWGLPIRNLGRGALSITDLESTTEANKDADFISLGHFVPHAVFPVAEMLHPGILEATSHLLEAIGIDVDLQRENACPVYWNFFLARSKALEAYVQTMLAPAIHAATSDRKLRELCFKSAGYFREFPSELQAIYGINYYPLHPFIGERLINAWILLSGARIRSIHSQGMWKRRSWPGRSLRSMAYTAQWRFRQWRLRQIHG